jgi:sugar phosphate isomerase/epimerase
MSLSLGYMNTSGRRLQSEMEKLGDEISFIEVQAHDKLKNSKLDFKISGHFEGYITIHGEEETDGIRRIRFSDPDAEIRKKYLESSATLYIAVADSLGMKRVRRIVLHPDKATRREKTQDQLRRMMESLAELHDMLPKSIQLCIEPRGDRSGRKVLKLDLEDLFFFEDYLGAGSGIGLCLDIAQIVAMHGNRNAETFLREVERMRLDVGELHLSDILTVGKLKNRVAMEIGTGMVDWEALLPHAWKLCRACLIETLGGIPVFRRSKHFLEKMIRQYE